MKTTRILFALAALVMGSGGTRAQVWPGYSDESTRLGAGAMHFGAPGGTNENYYDGDFADYDLDGDEASPSTTTILPGVTFTINSDQIEILGNAFDGTVVNDGGTLAVNLPVPYRWTIRNSGTVHLRNNGGPAFVTGAPVVMVFRAP